ncbi:MAG TPA: glycosyltransferase family 2 protein [Chthoniobacterales bacterium]|nr:glycosyltransferase family 2 protein [Chthoniobacterales bacterium]
MCCIATGPNRSCAGRARSQDRCVVLIPALDEEATIGGVIADLRRHGFLRIRVVDNGSSDRTAERARLACAELVTEPRRGYGRACWAGLQDLPADIEWILFCDADGSSDLQHLEQMFTVAAEADLVLGDRRTSQQNRAALSFAQRFGNGLATTLIRIGWGHHYADLGPLRLIRREALDRISMRDRGFGWTVEMQVRALEIGLRICEVPVRYRSRRGGKSKISATVSGTLRAGAVIVTTICRLFVIKLLRPLRAALATPEPYPERQLDGSQPQCGASLQLSPVERSPSCR